MSKPSLINKRRQALQGIQAAGYFGIPELKNPVTSPASRMGAVPI